MRGASVRFIRGYRRRTCWTCSISFPGGASTTSRRATAHPQSLLPSHFSAPRFAHARTHTRTSSSRVRSPRAVPCPRPLRAFQVSYAHATAGVGPHSDQYDVFLLQAGVPTALIPPSAIPARSPVPLSLPPPAAFCFALRATAPLPPKKERGMQRLATSPNLSAIRPTGASRGGSRTIRRTARTTMRRSFRRAGQRPPSRALAPRFVPVRSSAADMLRFIHWWCFSGGLSCVRRCCIGHLSSLQGVDVAVLKEFTAEQSWEVHPGTHPLHPPAHPRARTRPLSALTPSRSPHRGIAFAMPSGASTPCS